MRSAADSEACQTRQLQLREVRLLSHIRSYGPLATVTTLACGLLVVSPRRCLHDDQGFDCMMFL